MTSKRSSKKGTKRRSTRSKGLGDTVEKVAKKTGVKKLVEWVSGEDCGCEERRKKLNDLFRYRQPECLLQEEFDFLKEIYKEKTPALDLHRRQTLTRINNRVFKERKELSTCGPCYKRILADLEVVFKEYEKDN